MGILTVYLDKCTNLANTDWFGKSDPYVHLYLKQDNWTRDRDYGYQVSSTKRNELNPVYGETFTWNNIESLENLVLRIRIKDYDFGSRDDKVGSCNIKVNDLGLSPNNTFLDVERVVDRNVFTKNGMIYLKIAYTPDDHSNNAQLNTTNSNHSMSINAPNVLQDRTNTSEPEYIIDTNTEHRADPQHNSTFSSVKSSAPLPSRTATLY